MTRNGVPAAAVLPIDELRRLVEAEEELEDLRAVIAADREGGETGVGPDITDPEIMRQARR